MTLQEGLCIQECLDQVGRDLTHHESQRVVDLAIAVIESRWQQKEGEITSTVDAKNFFKLKLSHEKQEIFGAAFLDSSHQIIAYEALFRGTVDSASVYPRVVAQKALERNAAALIVAHNHPSGSPKPSRADVAITNNLSKALRLLDIQLLDHLIIGQNDPVSLAEEGEM